MPASAVVWKERGELSSRDAIPMGLLLAIEERKEE